MIQPSQPGYDLSVFELSQAKIDYAAISRVIVQSIQQSQATGAPPDITALLASLLRDQAKGATKYRIYPYVVANGFMQQILPDNPLRTALIVSVTSLNPVNIAFDQTSINAIATEVSILRRSMQISNTGTSSNPTQDFKVAPTNAVTVVAANGAVSGVIMEGVMT